MPKYQIKVSAYKSQMEVSDIVEADSFAHAFMKGVHLRAEFKEDAGAKIESIVNLDYREHEAPGCNVCKQGIIHDPVECAEELATCGDWEMEY